MGNDWDPRLKYGEGPRYEPDLNTLPPGRERPVLPAAEDAEPHDYVMGDVLKPMHTDPMCSECGAPRSDKRHQ